MFFHFNVEQPKSEPRFSWVRVDVREKDVAHSAGHRNFGFFSIVRESDDLVSVHNLGFIRKTNEIGMRGRTIAKDFQITQGRYVVRNDGDGFVSWRLA